MLIDVGVKSGNLAFYLVDKGFIFDLLDSLMSKEVLIKLVQKRKEIASKVKECLGHFRKQVVVLATQIDELIVLILVVFVERLCLAVMMPHILLYILLLLGITLVFIVLL